MAKRVKGIKIEIGGETLGFQKALKDLNKDVNKTQRELKNVNKLLELDPKNTELVAQKQQLLAKATQENENKLKSLKETKAKADKDMQNGTEVNQEQYRRLQREIADTENKLNGLETETKDLEKSSKKSFDNIANGLDKFGGKAEKAGKELTTKVTAPLVAVGGASMKSFSEVDDALDTVTTKTGATGNAMKDFETNFKNVAQKMPSDMQSVGDAIGEVNTQFGLTGEKLEKASEQMIKFSEINGQDVTSSTLASKGAMEAFELSADDLDGVLDSVTKTAQNTGVGTDKIFDSVTKGAPQLKAMGLDFSQSAEMMGRFEQKGIDSSKALSYMSKAQVTFAKEGKTLGQGMGELTNKIKNSSSETEQLSIASEYFGTKGASVMLDAINRGALDFKDFEDASKNASGSVTKTWEETQDPVDKLKTSMNDLKIAGADIAVSLQDTIEPVIKKIIKRLQNVVKKINKLSSSQKKIITQFSMVAAAIGPVLIGVGKVSKSVKKVKDNLKSLSKVGRFIKKAGKGVFNLGKGFGKLAIQAGKATVALGKQAIVWSANTAKLIAHKTATLALTIAQKAQTVAQSALNVVMNMNPIFLIITAIVALIATLVILWKKCDGFRKFIMAIWEWIKEIVGKIVAFFTIKIPAFFKKKILKLKKKWQNTKKFFKGLGPYIKGVFQGAWNGVKSVFSGVGKFFGGVLKTIKNVFSGIGGWFKKKFQGAWDGIKSVFSGVGKFFGGVWKTIKKQFTKIGTNIGKAVSGAFKGVVNGVLRHVGGKINGFFDFINRARKHINKIPGVNIGRIKPIDIPQLAKGGTLVNGQAIVAEAGPELISLINGKAVVQPLSRTSKNTPVKSNSSQVGSGSPNINFYNQSLSMQQMVGLVKKELGVT